MSNEREQLEQIVKDVPGRAKLAILLAIILGLLVAAHGIVVSTASGIFSGRTVLFAVIIFLAFLANGASLIRRSRWGYGLLILFTLLPVLGSFAGLIHLLALIATRTGGANLETLLSLMEIVQLGVIVSLLICLLSRPVRSFVWKRDDGTTAAQPSDAP